MKFATLRQSLLTIACAFQLATLGACLAEAESVTLVEAYSEIGAAIDFKARECGHRPTYPLIIPGRPDEYGVRLCSLSITRQACPFNDYPLFCLEMNRIECRENKVKGTIKKIFGGACDVPLIGP